MASFKAYASDVWRGAAPDRFSALKAFSLLHRSVLQFREGLYRRRVCPIRRLPCAVVSVGNLTVGGTGKTPMTMYLARLFQEAGLRVAVVSRGYKGTNENRVGVVSDGRSVFMSAAEAGDEPFMMAAHLAGIPVIVGRNRFRAGCKALAAFSSQVVVLDDGFQHRRLYRDMNILLLDHRHPLGNGFLLPRGPLREPPAAMQRADIVVRTRAEAGRKPGRNTGEAAVRIHTRGKAVFFAGHRPRFSRLQDSGTTPWPAEELQGLRLYGFSGIARNLDFRRTLLEHGCDLCGFAAFPDHHWFSRQEMEDILGKARKNGAAYVITTEKDVARLGTAGFPLMPLLIAGIDTCFGPQAGRFRRLVTDRVRQVLHCSGSKR